VPPRGPPPVAAFLQMLTKPVAPRAVTATRAGCVQRELGRVTPGARRGNISAIGQLHRNTQLMTYNTQLMTDNT